MNKIVRKLRLIDYWRIGETESWLTDMAAQGLHLIRLGWIACFEEGVPKNDRYRLDLSYSELTNEQKELYKDFGWEFVCRTGNIDIYRSQESSDFPELHTDPAEQAYTLQKLEQSLVFSAALTVPLFLASLIMNFFTIFMQKTPTLTFVEGKNFGILIMSLMSIYMIIERLKAVVSIRKLIRTMKDGKSINHHAKWKNQQRFSIIVLAIAPIFLILCMLPFIQRVLQRTEPLPLIDNNQLILRLTAIEQEPSLERHIGIIDRWSNDPSNQTSYNWSLFAPLQLTVEEQGIIVEKLWPDLSGTYQPNLHYRLFKLNYPFMADRLITDLSKQITSWNELHNEWFPLVEESERAQALGINRLLTRESNFFREVFAYKDNIVIYVKYYGLRDMDAVFSAVCDFVEHL